MIEWLALGLLGLFGEQERKPLRGIPSSNPGPNASQKLDEDKRKREEEFREALVAWRSQWNSTIDRDRWVPSGTAARIVSKFLPPERPSSMSWLRPKSEAPALQAALDEEFRQHNQAFLLRQKERLKPFFDTVERNPLTDEQIEACVCMDDNLLVVAAAGSGKTSTMVAKAGYALQEGLARGDQMLLLAFNNDAAEELAGRVRQRLVDFQGAEAITAQTFHAFGLHVIAKATGEKLRLASWIGTAGQEVAMVTRIAEDLSRTDSGFRHDWDLFRAVFGRDISGRSGASDGDSPVYQTASGGYVKSGEERLIANWLYYHSVPYEYERNYEHKTANAQYSQYQPDFYYPTIGLYHEHFAIGRNGKSPFGKKYMEGVGWKRNQHAKNGTDFLETTSAQISEGTALASLEATLRERGVEIRFDPKRKAHGPQPITDMELASRIRTFQQHAKCNGLTQQQLHDAVARHSASGDAARLKLFLSLYERISVEWERRLREANGIDFEDMLLLAADHVESGRYESPFTMILADEFQDTSRGRLRLLKALTKSTGRPVHFCAVGDDWQSINRFAGADVSVMTEFTGQFEHATSLMLSTTFRCPQRLCDVSSTFVQANPTQIRKTVTATNPFDGHTLAAYGLESGQDAFQCLVKRIERLHCQIREGNLTTRDGGRVSIMLLGRYRRDKPDDLTRWQKLYGDLLNIEFRTVHRSKGLEADYVVLLNVVEGMSGFPSQIEDDPLLQVPMPVPDPFPMAEERRLFYVALTRARRQVWIYTEIRRKSRFLLELEEQGVLSIRPIDR